MYVCSSFMFACNAGGSPVGCRLCSLLSLPVGDSAALEEGQEHPALFQLSPDLCCPTDRDLEVAL